MTRAAWFTSLTLLSLAIPAFAQHPRLESGPATLLSSPPVYTTARAAQWISAGVPTSAGWIALWSDIGWVGERFASRFLVSRLLPDGSVRDQVGIRLSVDSPVSAITAVPIPEGARIYLARADDGGPGRTVSTATVSDDGEVSDHVVIGEFPSGAISNDLSAAVAGTRTALLLDRHVMILDGTRLLRTVGLDGFGDSWSIVAVGSQFVVSWVAGGDIVMRQTIDLDGNAVGPAGGTEVGAPVINHALATDGTRVLLAWGDKSRLHFGVLDPASGMFIDKSSLESPCADLHAVWTGSSYLVVWRDWEIHALLGVHVSSEGEILDAEPLRLFEGEPRAFLIVARGSQVMLLQTAGECPRWSQCETDVYATPLDGESTEGHLISAAARSQYRPAVASDGRDFLVLWREAGRVFATETRERSRTPTAPIELGEAGGPETAIVGGESGYLATWSDLYDHPYLVEGKVLIPDGDTSFMMRPFSVQGGDSIVYNMAAGASPEMYLVLWRTGDEYKAVRVGTDGTLLDTHPLTLAHDDGWHETPSITFDGDDFVVAWSSHYIIKSIRVGIDGTVRFDRLWLSPNDGIIHGPSVGCADATCLIVWSELRFGTPDSWRVVGQRFRKGGALIDMLPFDIDASDDEQTGPSVDWDGRSFVVTWRWREYSEGVDAERVEARVIPAGGTVDLAPPDRVEERELADEPSVTTCNRGGCCIVVGTGPVDDATLGRTTRLFKRFFGEARHRAVRR